MITGVHYTEATFISICKPTSQISVQTSTGIMRKQMSQNTCFELAEAPEDDCCK